MIKRIYFNLRHILEEDFDETISIRQLVEKTGLWRDLLYKMNRNDDVNFNLHSLQVIIDVLNEELKKNGVRRRLSVEDLIKVEFFDDEQM